VNGFSGPDLPRRVFSPIARNYDSPALFLSLFQYRRWHRFLLSRLGLTPPSDGGRLRVLDMATGTGLLAFDLARAGAEVVAADVTRPMLARAAERFGRNGSHSHVDLIECTAESPPFSAARFDAVVFAYLLRYVADVPSTLQGLAGLLKPGGTMAALDFSVPRWPAYPAWRFYTGIGLPLAGRLVSREWGRVNSFLGGSIRDFDHRWPVERLLAAWSEAGMTDVRRQRLSLGGATVVWGRRES
jgi:demethylmenaquinone methyltransferase/2-methoxy-6-polyprenyl-1,4-benzoquinol methylase